ncbi:MAG: hypothetical protein R3Y64_05555 [Peptostreptococcaceae bacterium]
MYLFLIIILIIICGLLTALLIRNSAKNKNNNAQKSEQSDEMSEEIRKALELEQEFALELLRNDLDLDNKNEDRIESKFKEETSEFKEEVIENVQETEEEKEFIVFTKMTDTEFKDLVTKENNELNEAMLDPNKKVKESVVQHKIDILKRMKSIRDNSIDKENEIIKIKNDHKTELAREGYINKVRVLELLSKAKEPITMDELKDDSEIAKLSLQKMSILIKSLVDGCNIQTFVKDKETYYVYATSIGYDFSMLKNPIWKTIYEKQNVVTKIQPLELNELKESLFEDKGIVKVNINNYLEKYISLKLKVENPNLNSLLIECFNDISSIVVFEDYQKIIIDSGLNINTIKGIYLYTLKEFFESYCEGMDLKEHIETYTNIVSSMQKSIFMPTNTTYLAVTEAVGTYVDLVDGDFDVKNVSYDEDDNKYVKRFKDIRYVIEIVNKSSNPRNMFIKNKVNVTRLIDLFVNEVVYFKKDEVVRNDDKVEIAGMEFNNENIWLNPELLFNVDDFMREVISFVDFIENDTSLRIPANDVGREVSKFFDFNNLSAFGYFNLFVQRYVILKPDEELNSVKIRINEELLDVFPVIKSKLVLFTQLIFAYDNLKIEQKDIIFE